MIARLRLSALIALLAYDAGAQTTPHMSCGVDEPAALRSAPAGVSRMHDTLRVPWKNGTAIFTDSGPVLNTTDGVAYAYCRYDAGYGFHLISRSGDWELKGVLLDHETGRLLPAGYDVLFADDGSRYLAISHVDGNEADDWHIYARDGRLLWEGSGGVTAMDTSMKIMMTYGTLDDPHWTATRQLEAAAQCFKGGPKTTVMLVEKNGRYTWQEPSPQTISRVCASDSGRQ
jgi:hypothetical protein